MHRTRQVKKHAVLPLTYTKTSLLFHHTLNIIYIIRRNEFPGLVTDYDIFFNPPKNKFYKVFSDIASLNITISKFYHHSQREERLEN